MKIPFRSFDPKVTCEIYWSRGLPHWRQSGCTYFVTFRLADSLPRRAVEELERERDAFLRRCGIDPDAEDFKARYLKLEAGIRARFEREYATKLNRFLDAGYGSCELAMPRCAVAFRECLLRSEGSRLHVGDFVIMPNHVHTLLTPGVSEKLEELVRLIKGASARKINALTGGDGQLWQKGSFDHIVRDPEYLRKFQRYIAENPEKAGLTLGEGCVDSREYEVIE